MALINVNSAERPKHPLFGNVNMLAISCVPSENNEIDYNMSLLV